MAEALHSCLRSLLQAQYIDEGGELSSPDVGMGVGIIRGMKVGSGKEF